MSARVAVRRGYRVEYDRAAWSREPAIELDLAVLVLFDGACQVTIGGEATALTAPALALVNPGIALGAESGEGVVERLLVSLEAPVVDAAAVRLGFDDRGAILFSRAHDRPGGMLELSARRLQMELASDLAGPAAALDLAVEVFALDALRAYARTDWTSRLERSRAGLVDRRLRRAVEFMHDNYERDLGIGEIAAEAYLSEFHFARLFKRITGQTPHAYLASVRLAEGRRLLTNSDLSIAEIAQRVGYGSPSHFAKVFRASTGLTPTAFREGAVR